jgi:hypothetical protein
VRAPGARSGGQADRRSSLDFSLRLRKDSFPSIFFSKSFFIRVILNFFFSSSIDLSSLMKLVEFSMFCLDVTSLCGWRDQRSESGQLL